VGNKVSRFVHTQDFKKNYILKASIMVTLNLTLTKHTHEYEAKDIFTNLSKSKASESTQKH